MTGDAGRNGELEVRERSTGSFDVDREPTAGYCPRVGPCQGQVPPSEAFGKGENRTICVLKREMRAERVSSAPLIHSHPCGAAGYQRTSARDLCSHVEEQPAGLPRVPIICFFLCHFVHFVGRGAVQGPGIPPAFICVYGNPVKQT